MNNGLETDGLEVAGNFLVVILGMALGLAGGSYLGGADGALRGGILAPVGLVLFFVHSPKWLCDVIGMILICAIVILVSLVVCSCVFYLLLGDMDNGMSWKDFVGGAILEIVVFKWISHVGRSEFFMWVRFVREKTSRARNCGCLALCSGAGR